MASCERGHGSPSCPPRRAHTVVAYGDGSFSSSWAGTEPTPTAKFQKRLARKCRLHMVDEFRTSKLCCSCHGEMRGMPAGGSRLYGVRLCQDTACHRAKWNRDVNGAINIQNRFLEMVRGLPRAPPFCRRCRHFGCSKYAQGATGRCVWPRRGAYLLAPWVQQERSGSHRLVQAHGG